MNQKWNRVALAVTLGAVLTACSQVTVIETEDLALVVQRDGVPFDIYSVSEPVLDRLAAHKLVIVGETHLVREHGEMMSEIIRKLHARGFRQLLLEWPQMTDVLLEDYVTDRNLFPHWAPPVWLSGDMITAVRDLNRALPQSEHIRVAAIDVNLAGYGGASDFRLLIRDLSNLLPQPGPIGAFLDKDYDDEQDQAEAIRELRNALATSKAELVGMWGYDWYDTVWLMVDVEQASIPIRAIRENQYDLSVYLREQAMKQLADRRLEGNDFGTIVNVGGNHAQKEYLKGTRIEWLGEYLVEKSTAVGGTAFVLNVVPARIVSGPGGSTTDYDVRDRSPANELFRLIFETWPDDAVFLPMDDPIFRMDNVPMNYESTIYVCAPKDHYDAIIALPTVQRVPLPES